MGFWHTGYIEFHEETGLPSDWVPEPTRYRCTYCNDVFDTHGQLKTHRFESHPVRRPSLWIRGQELGATTYRITRGISLTDVVTEGAESAWVNGHPCSPDEVQHQLQAATNDRMKITLEREGIRTQFDILIEIAGTADIKGVERAFWSLVRNRRLDERSVEEFIAAAQAFTTTKGYANGIAAYLHGVLAKEKAATVLLEFDDHAPKFEEATGSLMPYDRPLARTIRSLVAFQFNQFDDALAWPHHGPLHHAAGRFAAWISASVAPDLLDELLPSFESTLADEPTQRLLDLCRHPVGSSEIEPNHLRQAVAASVSPYDRVKFQLALAEHLAATGSFEESARIARELRHNPSTGAWSEWLLNRRNPVGDE